MNVKNLKCNFSLLNLKVSVNFENDIDITNDLIGMVNCNFIGLQGRLKMGDYETIDLVEDSNDFCILPNGNLLFSNFFTSTSLALYDENFVFIKSIKRLNNKDVRAFSIETNSIDRVYINDNGENILMTDLEFNYLGEYNQYNADKLKTAYYMLFHNELLYICDYNDNSILILNSDLVNASKIYLDIKPVQLKILNNLAFVVPSKEDKFLYLYNLTDFKIVLAVDRCSRTIAHENIMYGLNQAGIQCFDKNGNIIDSIKLNFKKDFINLSTPFMKMNKNNRLYIKFNDNKLIII
jgi:hypothetical protein